MSILKSLHGDVPVVEVPLHKAVFMRLSELGDSVAMIDGVTGRQVTYRQLVQTSQRVASGLVKLGLRKGDIVSIFSPNSLDYIIMFWGVLWAGGTVTTVNPSYTKYELVNHLKDSGAKFIYTLKELLPLCKQAAREVNSLQHVICSGVSDPDCVSAETLCSDDGSLWQTVEEIEFNVREDVAVILYSSGTTGVPKGVLLTHYNVMALIAQASVLKDALPARADEGDSVDTTLAILPFYHIAGLLAVMLLGCLAGSKHVLLAKFEPHTFLSAIQNYKVSYLPLVPPLAVFMAKSPLVHSYDLSSLRYVVCGAAPLSKSTEEELMNRLKVPNMQQGYGMTELTLFGTAAHASMKVKPGSCGGLAPMTEAKIVDPESGKVLGPNERGELWLRGPQIMKGYLNNPQATRDTIDQDGFLHTGDIAYYDSEGFFFIVGRIKELIKVKGLQVAPAELEALLLTHPEVSDVGVVGVPDQRAGELPRAYVVKKINSGVTAQEIHRFVAERLAPFKHLKGGVVFVNEIPKLPSGKIIRRKLKDMNKKSRL